MPKSDLNNIDSLPFGAISAFILLKPVLSFIIDSSSDLLLPYNPGSIPNKDAIQLIILPKIVLLRTFDSILAPDMSCNSFIKRGFANNSEKNSLILVRPYIL